MKTIKFCSPKALLLDKASLISMMLRHILNDKTLEKKIVDTFSGLENDRVFYTKSLKDNEQTAADEFTGKHYSNETKTKFGYWHLNNKNLVQYEGAHEEAKGKKDEALWGKKESKKTNKSDKHEKKKNLCKEKINNIDTNKRNAINNEIKTNKDKFNQQKGTGIQRNGHKMINETAKIFGKKIDMSVTCVRVPVFRCHAESVNVEFEKDFDINDLVEFLSDSEILVVQDRNQDGCYAVQTEVVGTDNPFISRIRRDFSVKSGINFWLVCDNLRKGAALNGVQIAEELIKNM